MEENQTAVAPIPPASFDVKELGLRILARALPKLKAIGADALDETLDWLEEGVKASPNKVDDVALAVIPPFRAWAKAKLGLA